MQRCRDAEWREEELLLGLPTGLPVLGRSAAGLLGRSAGTSLAARETMRGEVNEGEGQADWRVVGVSGRSTSGCGRTHLRRWLCLHQEASCAHGRQDEVMFGVFPPARENAPMHHHMTHHMNNYNSSGCYYCYLLLY